MAALSDILIKMNAHFLVIVIGLFLVNQNSFAFANGNDGSLDSDVDDNYKIVATEHGLLRGQRELTLFNKKPFYSFRGVRYGRPPVKELRFKVRELTWEQIWIESENAKALCCG